MIKNYNVIAFILSVGLAHHVNGTALKDGLDSVGECCKELAELINNHKKLQAEFQNTEAMANEVSQLVGRGEKRLREEEDDEEQRESKRQRLERCEKIARNANQLCNELETENNRMKQQIESKKAALNLVFQKLKSLQRKEAIPQSSSVSTSEQDEDGSSPDEESEVVVAQEAQKGDDNNVFTIQLDVNAKSKQNYINDLISDLKKAKEKGYTSIHIKANRELDIVLARKGLDFTPFKTIHFENINAEKLKPLLLEITGSVENLSITGNNVLETVFKGNKNPWQKLTSLTLVEKNADLSKQIIREQISGFRVVKGVKIMLDVIESIHIELQDVKDVSFLKETVGMILEKREGLTSFIINRHEFNEDREDKSDEDNEEDEVG